MIAKKIEIPRQPFTIVLSVAGIMLLASAFVLGARIGWLSRENSRNTAMLNQVWPGLDEQALAKLKNEISSMEASLLAMAHLFDPSQKGLKKDYDPAIYFVDELGKTSQALKAKAASKQLEYNDLGFKEKLPDEKEVPYLLKQLSLLNEAVSRGIDCGVNFTSISPQPAEEVADISNTRMVKARMELKAPVASFLEFIVQLSQIEPLAYAESLNLKTEDSNLKGEIVIAQLLIDADWKYKDTPFTPLSPKIIFADEATAVNTLRGSDVFAVPKTTLTSPQAGDGAGSAEKPKQAPRFIYRGKAVLRDKEVAVVEDTLAQKTVFVASGEKINDFILRKFDNQEIILENADSSQKITIKREGR